VAGPPPVTRGFVAPAGSRGSHAGDWSAGRNAVYQLAALTIGAHLALADA
jgi:hypothetical protein